MQNVESTVISEFSTSPHLAGWIYLINQSLDPITNLNNFYDLIWNLDTAQGYGLDVWGRIVGVSRILQVSSGEWLGFEEANDYPVFTPFNVAPFYDGSAISGNFALTDTAYRTLIYAKAAANLTDGSIPSINSILMTLFGDSGECWCTDGQDMTMTYSFAFTLSPLQYAIVDQSGVLPRPPGVSVTIVQNATP